MSSLGELDHVAILVADTEVALTVWRDRVGLDVLFSETIGEGTIRLTHLQLGGAQLQLVQPLVPTHPLADRLREQGECLHHICLAVPDIGRANRELASRGLAAGEPRPHQGTLGKRALFLDRTTTGGIQVELTGR